MAGQGSGVADAALVSASSGGGGNKPRKRRVAAAATTAVPSSSSASKSSNSSSSNRRAALQPIEANLQPSSIAKSLADSNKEINATNGLVTPTNDSADASTGTFSDYEKKTSSNDNTTTTNAATGRCTCRSTSKTNRSRHSFSTSKQQHHAAHDASFFSPPRIVREPIPFLSPTTPSYKDFVGTDDGTCGLCCISFII